MWLSSDSRQELCNTCFYFSSSSSVKRWNKHFRLDTHKRWVFIFPGSANIFTKRKYLLGSRRATTTTLMTTIKNVLHYSTYFLKMKKKLCFLHLATFFLTQKMEVACLGWIKVVVAHLHALNKHEQQLKHELHELHEKILWSLVVVSKVVNS